MRPLLTAATLACTLLLSGCAGMTGGLAPYHKTVTEAQLIGTWKGDCHSTLTVRANHGLDATGFPTAADATKLTITSRASGTGDWQIFPGAGDTPATLQISVGATTAGLDFAASSDGSLELTAAVGDPDNGVSCRFTQAR
jgi:hypothetical protein